VSPDPSEALRAVRELTRQGRFAKALERQLWFHEHAFEYRPSLSAVRLSYGLSAWVELARQYPPARDALLATRDRLAAAVRGGDTAFDRFHELAAINEHLGEPAQTAPAFLALRASYPEVARQYYRVAEKGLVAAGEFAVCSEYIPDAMARVEYLGRNRRHMLASAPRPLTEAQTAELRAVVEARFTEEAVRLVEILTRVGRVPEAERVRELAAAEVESESARAAILGWSPDR
jgi:hypothetical protein